LDFEATLEKIMKRKEKKQRKEREGIQEDELREGI